MRPHLFTDSGGMVTGTRNVERARRLMVDLWLEENAGLTFEVADRYDIAEASRMFRVRDATVETGRVVPARPDDPDYSWYWMSGYELGKPGVTVAVVWL
jgi:hypothetical protein